MTFVTFPTVYRLLAALLLGAVPACRQPGPSGTPAAEPSPEITVELRPRIEALDAAADRR